MIYLSSLTLPTRDAEETFFLNFPHQLEMQCYSHTNIYPFKLFPDKGLSQLDFEPITLLYGGNGSGKSTLLNIISEKLSLGHTAPFNDTPFMEPYLARTSFKLAYGINFIPDGSRKMTSDDVFDSLIDQRTVNEKIDKKRDRLFAEYEKTKDEPIGQLRSISELNEFRRRLEAKTKTKSVYTAKRLPKELDGMSNGETAFEYFTDNITENALYVLDEPENSLSAELQIKLASFIEDSARFYNCQFIISTHSPFVLAMKGSKIYDLDSKPVNVKRWTELGNIRTYYNFFKEHSKEF